MRQEPAIRDLPAAERRIREILDTLRPSLMEDSGDVELVSVSPDGIVEVRFLGECAGCSMSLLTLQAGIQKTIMHAMPEVRRVNAV